MKKLLKSFMKRRAQQKGVIRNLYYGTTDNLTLLEELSPFVPNSSGNIQQPHLTLSAAKNSLSIMADLTAEYLDKSEITAIDMFGNRTDASNIQNELKSLLDQYGSDKASTHNYHLLYAKILSDLRNLNRNVSLLEIGLGTNNTDVISNMGRRGKPGASLRAFRDFLQNGHIYGADVDRRVLFQDKRIKTGFVDQTRPETFEALINSLDIKSLDLFIDDGLHSPEANLNTLQFALRFLQKGAWFIIEDIPKEALPVWEIMHAILKAKFESWIISSKSAYMFVLKI